MEIDRHGALLCFVFSDTKRGVSYATGNVERVSGPCRTLSFMHYCFLHDTIMPIEQLGSNKEIKANGAVRLQYDPSMLKIVAVHSSSTIAAPRSCCCSVLIGARGTIPWCDKAVNERGEYV